MVVINGCNQALWLRTPIVSDMAILLRQLRINRSFGPDGIALCDRSNRQQNIAVFRESGYTVSVLGKQPHVCGTVGRWDEFQSLLRYRCLSSTRKIITAINGAPVSYKAAIICCSGGRDTAPEPPTMMPTQR